MKKTDLETFATDHGARIHNMMNAIYADNSALADAIAIISKSEVKEAKYGGMCLALALIAIQQIDIQKQLDALVTLVGDKI